MAGVSERWQKTQIVTSSTVADTNTLDRIKTA
jgi:hypothetical protein